MPNWKKLIVSGSDASLNSLTVATNVNAQSFTGSLFGTASWAQNASTSSYVLNAISSSFAQTASSVNPLSQNVSLTGTLNVTGSVNISGSTGNVFTANIDTIAFTGSFLQSGSVNVNGSVTATNFTGSLFGTASYAVNAVSSSFATQAVTASYALTASSATLFNLSSSLYSAQGSSIGAGTTAIVSISTGSYKAGFFDYTVYNTGNARAGTVMSAWNGSTVTYTDNSTTDIGSTNSVTMSVALNGGSVELRTTAGTTWTVNTTYRLI